MNPINWPNSFGRNVNDLIESATKYFDAQTKLAKASTEVAIEAKANLVLTRKELERI